VGCSCCLRSVGSEWTIGEVGSHSISNTSSIVNPASPRSNSPGSGPRLAAGLGLAKNTIGRAYRALEDEGLVVGDRRRGTIVTDRATTADERDRALTKAAQAYLDELTTIEATIEEGLAAIARLHDRSTTNHDRPSASHRTA
jgi:DNA-binding transcriptional regulator YhcF (GntR family)